MKWKINIAMMTIFILFVQATVPASASTASTPVSLFVNDLKLDQTNAFFQDDELYLPFRAIFQQLDIPIEYDKESHSISYVYQNEPYAIDITQEIIYTPNGGYRLLVSLRMVEQRTYIPQSFVEDLLRLPVEYNEKNNQVNVYSLGYAHDSTIHRLANSYYEHDIPANLLFTYDADPYGYLRHFDDAQISVLTDILDTKIGAVYYQSLTEAIVKTSQSSVTPAVSRYVEIDLHFRLEEGQWKISKFDFTKLQIDLLDDAEEKIAELLQSSPEKVNQVLSDLKANYAAKMGTDPKAALEAYSPLFIDEWNRSTVDTWEEVIDFSIRYPSQKKELIDAKVIYVDDTTAVVYVRVRLTELAQTYDGLYEPRELEGPYEYEEILYLDNTDGKRWTFNESDPLDSNY